MSPLTEITHIMPMSEHRMQPRAQRLAERTCRRQRQEMPCFGPQLVATADACEFLMTGDVTRSGCGRTVDHSEAGYARQVSDVPGQEGRVVVNR